MSSFRGWLSLLEPPAHGSHHQRGLGFGARWHAGLLLAAPMAHHAVLFPSLPTAALEPLSCAKNRQATHAAPFLCPPAPTHSVHLWVGHIMGTAPCASHAAPLGHSAATRTNAMSSTRSRPAARATARRNGRCWATMLRDEGRAHRAACPCFAGTPPHSGIPCPPYLCHTQCAGLRHTDCQLPWSSCTHCGSLWHTVASLPYVTLNAPAGPPAPSAPQSPHLPCLTHTASLAPAAHLASLHALSQSAAASGI